jgi:LmbE family N-acetylglucosaminyl deacetylase
MTPIVSEHEWRAVLDGYPEWSPPNAKTIILTPHPDDETLSAGGLIADLVRKKIDVSLISVTDGENAYVGHSDLGSLRVKEQEKALSILGLPQHKIERLKLIDSNISASEILLEYYLLSIIKRPVNIIASWSGDFHPDHEAVGRVAQLVAQKTASFLSFYFFWTWHRGTLDTIKDLPLRLYKLSHDSLQLKQQAIQCYISQLSHDVLEPILPQNLLLPTHRPYEVFLPV